MGRPRASGGSSWVRIAAVLTGCVVTLIGVVCGLAPETILLRSGLAVVLIGTLLAAARGVLQRF